MSSNSDSDSNHTYSSSESSESESDKQTSDNKTEGKDQSDHNSDAPSSNHPAESESNSEKSKSEDESAPKVEGNVPVSPLLLSPDNDNSIPAPPEYEDEPPVVTETKKRRHIKRAPNTQNNLNPKIMLSKPGEGSQDDSHLHASQASPAKSQIQAPLSVNPAIIDSEDSNDTKSRDETDDLARLYSILKPTEEDQQRIAAINTDPFPKENEWVYNEDRTLPERGSFVQLMLFLTMDEAGLPYQSKFLKSFPSFATPRQLLAAVFKRYYVNPKEPGCNIQESEIKQMRNRLIRILQFWMKIVPYQFDDVMKETIQEFIKILNEPYEKNVLPTQQSKKSPQAVILEQRFKALIGEKDNIHKLALNNAPKIKYPKISDKKKWRFIDIDSEEIARQVTLLHSKIFRKIGVMELLSAIWGSKRGGGSEHVDELTRLFDLLSRYVQFSIISEMDKPKNRANLFVKWFDVAVYFEALKNYHGVFAIMYGLTHRSVQRMPDTMKIVKKLMKKKQAKYNDLDSLCQLSGNYAKYRPVIEKITPPCIPFIGCFQKDLIYVQEGFPNTIDGLINFKKCINCVALIEKVADYQSNRYELQKDKDLRTIISTFPEMPDTTGMMKLSQEKEKKK